MLLKTIFMILYPNAKINIGLNVESRRSDGYHNISSVFYPINQCFDILEIVESENFRFTSSGINVPDCINICEKAYKLMKVEYQIPSVHIHLHKQIPIGSGLGGGSSDGACTIKGLNTLFNLNIHTELLEELALKLGADCPFFIQNKPKYVSGIGDVMKNISIELSNYNIKLINSNIYISTIDAYSNIKPKDESLSLIKLIKRPIDLWKDSIKNDFERSIFNIHPVLKEAKEKLYSQGAIYSSMTGTGSVIYGIFNKE